LEINLFAETLLVFYTGSSFCDKIFGAKFESLIRDKIFKFLVPKFSWELQAEQTVGKITSF